MSGWRRNFKGGDERRVRTFTKWIIIAFPLLILVAVLALNWPGRPTHMPEKIWGVWRTDHPRYTDRYLDISEAIFTIGQGQERLQVFFFQRVEMTPVGSRERYTLYYHPDERSKSPLQTFSFDFFATDEAPRIQLINQKNVFWYREADRHSSDAATEAVTP